MIDDKCKDLPVSFPVLLAKRMEVEQESETEMDSNSRSLESRRDGNAIRARGTLRIREVENWDGPRSRAKSLKYLRRILRNFPRLVSDVFPTFNPVARSRYHVLSTSTGNNHARIHTRTHLKNTRSQGYTRARTREYDSRSS